MGKAKAVHAVVIHVSTPALLWLGVADPYSKGVHVSWEGARWSCVPGTGRYSCSGTPTQRGQVRPGSVRGLRGQWLYQRMF